MIEHLLWAKDSDRWLGTRNAYEVVSLPLGTHRQNSGPLGQPRFSESWPESWTSAERLLFPRFTPHSSHTLHLSSLLLVCGSNLHQRYHHAISLLSTEAGAAGILPPSVFAWPTVHRIIYIIFCCFPHRHCY